MSSINNDYKEKYDFYNNLPNTKQDVYDYITTWLETYYDKKEIIINNEKWIMTEGFRRAFYNHFVFKNLDTLEYAFHVFEYDIWGDNDEKEGFPNFGRYKTYNEMIEGIVNKYVKAWNITN